MKTSTRSVKAIALGLALILLFGAGSVFADTYLFDPDTVIDYFNNSSYSVFCQAFELTLSESDVLLYESESLSDANNRVYASANGGFTVSFARDGSQIVIYCSLEKDVANLPMFMWALTFYIMNGQGAADYSAWAEPFMDWYFKDEYRSAPFHCDLFDAEVEIISHVSLTMTMTRV